MKRFRAVALCACIVATLGVSAAQACATKDDLLAQLAVDMPGTVPAVATGEAARRLAIGIAKLVGGEELPGGDFALVDLRASQLTYVVRFADGCATHHGRFPTTLVRHWLLGGAQGDGQ